MKIVKDYPPIWDQIKATGMCPDPSKVAFTYGDTIYVPSGMNVPDYLIRHESVHSEQQGDNPEAWWSRYIDDQYFRIEQETEAYAASYKFLCKRVTDRNQRAVILAQLARSLSGPIYGNVISLIAAIESIKIKANVK